METRRISVQRSARYHVLGDLGGASTLWFVLHGYGHLGDEFLASFEPHLGAGRAFVAPEGLSRFYLRRTSGRIGASWMTSLEREHEVRDYVSYLDAVARAVGLGAEGSPRLCVLGFSQGVATACRWTALGEARPERLVLWAGGVPPDLDLERAAQRWRDTEITLVAGSRDNFGAAENVARDAARLTDVGLGTTEHLYEGGHALDATLLERLLVSDT